MATTRSKRGGKAASTKKPRKKGGRTSLKSGRAAKKAATGSPIIITGGSFTIELLGGRRLRDLDNPAQGRRVEHEDNGKKVRNIIVDAPGSTVQTSGSTTTIAPNDGDFEITFSYR